MRPLKIWITAAPIANAGQEKHIFSQFYNKFTTLKLAPELGVAARMRKPVSVIGNDNRCIWKRLRSTILVMAAGVFININSAAADEHQTCSQVLNGPVLKDALTRNDGRDWRVFIDSGVLIGVACDPDELDAYFEAGGWAIGSRGPSKPGTPIGPFGPPGKEFYTDYGLGYAYCKRRIYFPLFQRKCTHSIQIRMFEGRIAHITGGANK